MVDSALDIVSAEELVRFDLGTVEINHTTYTVLTGYEGTERRCFWCGGELTGKLKRYCYGHMKLYYQHFEWGSARAWCCERQKGICANCGWTPVDYGDGSDIYYHYSLEVHHIIPLEGAPRYFSAYNLPWNLIGFCHECHLEVRDAMKEQPPDIFDLAFAQGQAVMEFCRRATNEMPRM